MSIIAGSTPAAPADDAPRANTRWWQNHGIRISPDRGQSATVADLQQFMTACQAALAEVSPGYAAELAAQWKRDQLDPLPADPAQPCDTTLLRRVLAPVHELLAEAAPDWHAAAIRNPQDAGKPAPPRSPVYPWADQAPAESTASIASLEQSFAIDPSGLKQHRPLRRVRGLVRPAQRLSRELDAMLVGKAGGETGMAVFSSYDHLAASYRRNDRLWCRELGRQLTGVAVYKGPRKGSWDSYGGTMITPRHVLFCNHAHPHPAGSPRWPNGLGQQLRFITADGKIVERTLIHGQRVPGKDLWIGLIDSPVPAAIAVYRLSPDIPGLYSGAFQPFQAPEIGFSQGTGRLTPERSYQKWSPRNRNNPPTHYGTVAGTEEAKTYHQVPMIYVAGTGMDSANQPKPSPRNPFSYRVWDGDSGTPRFHLVKGELLLTRIISGAAVAGKGDMLDATIATVDATAITAGLIDRPTRLTTRTADPALLGYNRPPDADPAIPGLTAKPATTPASTTPASAPAAPNQTTRRPRPRVVPPPPATR